MKRVGFLFNHYAPHQVVHAAPYAFELSRRHPQFEVTIAASSAAEMATAERIGALYPGQRCALRRLDPPAWYVRLDPLVSRLTFTRKRLVLSRNVAFFAGLDALVVPERHSLRLRQEHRLDRVKLIHTLHGAGDRELASDALMAQFDLVLLPGRKYFERYDELGFLPPGRAAIVGYPKFEVVRALGVTRRRFFDNDRPVVVYNPHFDQRIGSWSRMGLAVLEFFATHPHQYNLIFAPHLVLFKRRWRHRAILPERYRRAPNIRIDTGSERLADMTYMLAADVYLGDVSSQVYEFLLEPRPCVFLSAHRVDWQGNPNYAHWHFGPVVDDVSRLGAQLERAIAGHADYLPVQRDGFARTFFSDPQSTAAQRGADAIARFLLAASDSPGAGAASAAGRV
jgi:hypothetical protein